MRSNEIGKNWTIETQINTFFLTRGWANKMCYYFICFYYMLTILIKYPTVGNL